METVVLVPCAPEERRDLGDGRAAAVAHADLVDLDVAVVQETIDWS